jgi:ABC-2 type transport system permease protein
MSRFNTLLLREWMQHHRGWLVMMLAPPLLILLVVPFGTVEIGPGELGPVPAVALMMMAMAAVPALVLGITAVALLFQTTGLARRDQQDRSIEFWLSLPTSHSASIGATVLMHLVLVPLVAVVIGAVLGHAIGFALVWKGFGATAAFTLPWGALMSAGAAGLVRALLGVVLACAWLMPLLLLTMAASAWLKRWGAPILALVLSIGHKLLATFYGITWIGDTVGGLVAQARSAMVHDLPMRTHGVEATLAWLDEAPRWFFMDGLAALRDLGQPLFAFAIVASAACFGLLMLRRSRSG